MFDEIKKRTAALRHFKPQGYQPFVTEAIEDRQWLVDYLEEFLTRNGTFSCPYCGKGYPHEHFVDRKGNVEGKRP